jgi:N6-L-threonylcarbamoyladenine synthase
VQGLLPIPAGSAIVESLASFAYNAKNHAPTFFPALFVTVLGIETSCDETSAAIVDDGVVLSNVISSQMEHGPYGGVVPEIASRAHIRLIVQVVEQALHEARLEKRDLSAIGVTYGPGLAGALIVGLSFAKSLSFVLHVPFIGVNHLEGHLYSNFLSPPGPVFPFLSLIVSGGHTMLVHVRSPLEHQVLGETRDDAAGEAFDKVAKMLGLGYPGGPEVDRIATAGDPAAIRFPRSYLGEGTFDFSFSGIKTAVLYYLRDKGLGPAGSGAVMTDQHRADICAGFQASVADVLVTKTIAAARQTGVRHVTIAGGVSANSLLRKRMHDAASESGVSLHFPPLRYCMDNGAMIAYAGWLRLSRGERSDERLNVVPNLTL